MVFFYIFTLTFSLSQLQRLKKVFPEFLVPFEKNNILTATILFEPFFLTYECELQKVESCFSLRV